MDNEIQDFKRLMKEGNKEADKKKLRAKIKYKGGRKKSKGT